jgi:hypothetical protein
VAGHDLFNYVRVTFDIPAEAAVQLSLLENKGCNALHELGINFLQVQGTSVRVGICVFVINVFFIRHPNQTEVNYRSFYII